MDLLEKALEKAHSKQAAEPEFIDGDADQTAKQSPETLRPAAPEIVYSQTRTVMHNAEELRSRRVVAMQKHDPIADVFRMLRTKILKQLRTNQWNSFAITAPTKGAGKSMIAANLAISIAMEVNQTVLLVDLDLRRPRLDWYFDLDVKYGILDYVQNDVPLSQILINPGIERLVILPAVGETKGSSELISAPKMKRLIDDIKNRYQSRIIIFDMPPILAIDDVLAAADYYDAVLLVVEDGASKPAEVTKSLQMLSNTNLLGMVLNKSETLPEHQGYY